MSSPHDDIARSPSGEPVYDHRNAPDRVPGLVPRNAELQQAREAHLRSFLGDRFTVLTEKSSLGFHLDVYVFAPSEDLPHFTLVTSGMSDLPMTMPGGQSGDRLELMLAVPVGWPGIDPPDAGLFTDPANYWPIRLLKEVARIPFDYGSFVAWGHTISSAEFAAAFPVGSGFTGALVGPPLGYPPRIMRATQTPVGEVDYLALFPATAAELEFKVSVPGGGDLLIDRYGEAGVSAVVNPGRPSVVAGPPPWSIHLLLRDRAGDLGDIMDRYLPETAAMLKQNGDTEFLMPVSGEQVRWRVSGPIAAAPLAQAVPDGQEQLAAAVRHHRGVLTLTPERHGAGDQVVSVFAMAMAVAERDDVLAVWLPHQHYVATGKQFLAEVGDKDMMFQVHRTATSGDGAAVITRGLAALNGTEVFLSDPKADAQELTARLRRILNRLTGEETDLPRAGQVVKRISGHNYELRPGVDPVSGEQVLQAVAVDSGGFFRRR